MSLKKLIATAAVLVGSSTAALAQPYHATVNTRSNVVVRDHRDVDAQWMRNHRRPVVVKPQIRWYAGASYSVQPTYYNEPVYQAPVYQAPVYQAPGWTSVMPAQSLQGVASLQLGSQPGAFHALRLESASGDTFITTVAITYTDGRTQLATVGQELTPSSSSYEIALDSSCGIANVSINGQSEYGGSIALAAL